MPLQIGMGQVMDHDAGDLLALPVGVAHVDQPQVVTLAEGRQQLAGNVAGGAGQQDSSFQCINLTGNSSDLGVFLSCVPVIWKGRVAFRDLSRRSRG